MVLFCCSSLTLPVKQHDAKDRFCHPYRTCKQGYKGYLKPIRAPSSVACSLMPLAKLRMSHWSDLSASLKECAPSSQLITCRWIKCVHPKGRVTVASQTHCAIMHIKCVIQCNGYSLHHFYTFLPVSISFSSSIPCSSWCPDVKCDIWNFWSPIRPPSVSVKLANSFPVRFLCLRIEGIFISMT